MIYNTLVIKFEEENITLDDLSQIDLTFSNYKLSASESIKLIFQYYNNESNDSNNPYINHNLRYYVEKSNNTDLLINIVLYCISNATLEYIGDDTSLNAIFQFQDYVIQRINALMNTELEELKDTPLSLEFKSYYNEFKDRSGERIEILYTRLKCLFPFISKSSCKYKQMGYLILAHYLTLENTSGSVVGYGMSVINSASIGGVSVSVSQITPTSYWQQFFATSKYGLEFLALRSTIGSTTLVN